jgi:phenylacetate-CoA ligase
MPSDLSQRQTIEAGQLQALHGLIARVVPTNSFWTPKFEAAGLMDGPTDLKNFSQKMPLLTKAQISQDHVDHPPFGSNLTDPIDSYTRIHHTSGTTAKPLRWPDTPDSWQWMLENWKTVYTAAGVRSADTIFFAFSFGPFLGFWTAFEAATQMQAQCLSGGGMSTQQRLRAMVESGCTVLCCTPTYGVHLARTAAEAGIDAKDLSLRTVVVAGEPGGSISSIREQISDGLGAEVFDHHGMTEVGPVTHQCTGRIGSLRVIESAYLAEVIDPETGEPTPPGQIGELVLTTLGRDACPLFRYRTGDLVRPRFASKNGEGDGPHLTLDGGILDRADDMIIVRGVNVFPSAVDQLLRTLSGVVEYRAHVEQAGALTELRLEIEPDPSVSVDDLIARVETAAHEALSLRVPVSAVAPGSLPRFEMKARRWIRPETSNEP